MKTFVRPLVAALCAVLSAGAFAALDVNKAGQADLEGIKGIGPAMSAKILDARKAGPFKDWADLQSRVKGVRDKTSAKFSGEGLTVNGAAYAGQKPGVAPTTAATGARPGTSVVATATPAASNATAKTAAAAPSKIAVATRPVPVDAVRR